MKGGLLEDALAKGSDDDDAEDALDAAPTSAALESTARFRLKLYSIQTCKQKKFPHWGSGICWSKEATGACMKYNDNPITPTFG